MSTASNHGSPFPNDMKSRLHDVRRAEVYERFVKQLEPIEPSQQAQWDEVRKLVLNAVFDMNDVLGPQDLDEYNKAKVMAIEAMMDFHLVLNVEAAEQEFYLMEAVAEAVTVEVHASDYDRERLHSVAKRTSPDAIKNPKHDLPIGTRPMLANPAGMPRELRALPAPQVGLAERTQHYFTEQNRRFWDNHGLSQLLEDAYAQSSIDADDVDLALYQSLKPRGVEVTRVPSAKEYMASPREVQEFLETHDLQRAATHVWLLKQFEDKYVMLAAQVAQDIGLEPGKPARGQLMEFELEFNKRLTPFKHDLLDKQEEIMGATGREAFIRDFQVLEASSKRALDSYVSRGPDAGMGGLGK